MRAFSDIRKLVIVLVILSFSLVPAAFAQSWVQEDSPTTNSLNDVWVSASVNQTPPPAVSLKMFGVGNNGTIVTSTDGTTWTTQASGIITKLNAVWGSAVNSVYAVGQNNIVLHYNGTAWSTVNSGGAVMLYDVWGHVSGSTTQIYAVGENGRILSYNGTSWSSITRGTRDLRGIWGSSQNDVFVVGDSGTIFHYDGETWETQSSGVSTNLNSVWGTSPDSVFAVGDSGVILWYDGESWLRLRDTTTITTNSKLTAVWGTSYCNVYAVGELLDSGRGVVYFFDGSSWSSQADSIVMDTEGAPVAPLRGIHGASIRNIFAVGDSLGADSLILSYDADDGEELPLVCAKLPADEEDDVLTETTISAAFNAVMDAATITSSTFTVSSASGQVAGAVTYSDNTATFTPSSNLAKSTTYTVTLSKDIEDILGFPISTTEDYTWSFTTGNDSYDASSSGGCFLSTARKKSGGKSWFGIIKKSFLKKPGRK